MLLSYNEKNKAYTCPTSYGFFVFKINPYEVVLKQGKTMRHGVFSSINDRLNRF